MHSKRGKEGMNNYFWASRARLTVILMFLGQVANAQIPTSDQEYIFMATHRSHTMDFYDAVLDQEHSPFLFTPCVLGNAMRLASYLVGEVHAATYDQTVYDHIVQTIEAFSYRVLDLYALYYQAYHEVLAQVTLTPEKQQYLFSEIAHLQERISKFSALFTELIGSAHNDYVQTIQVACRRMGKKTEQLLSPDF